MKRIILTLALLLVLVSARAGEGRTIIIDFTNGDSAELALTDNTSVTFADEALTIHCADIPHTFRLDDVSSFRYGTATSELAISIFQDTNADAACEIFDLQGRRIAAASIADLAPGTYIINTPSRSVKIAILK